MGMCDTVAVPCSNEWRKNHSQDIKNLHEWTFIHRVMDYGALLLILNHFFFSSSVWIALVRTIKHIPNETKWNERRNAERTQWDGLYCSHKKRQLAYKSNLCFTKWHLWEYKWWWRSAFGIDAKSHLASAFYVNMNKWTDFQAISISLSINGTMFTVFSLENEWKIVNMFLWFSFVSHGLCVNAFGIRVALPCCVACFTTNTRQFMIMHSVCCVQHT